LRGGGGNLPDKQAHLPELLPRETHGPAEGTRDGDGLNIVRRVWATTSSGRIVHLLGHTGVGLHLRHDLIGSSARHRGVCSSDLPENWDLRVEDLRGPSQHHSTGTGREGWAGQTWFFLTVVVSNAFCIGAGLQVVDARAVGGKDALLVRGKAVGGVVGGHDMVFSDRLLMVRRGGWGMGDGGWGMVDVGCGMWNRIVGKSVAAHLGIFSQRPMYVAATLTETHVTFARLEGVRVL